MARPRAGTKEGNLATERWRQTMLKKYGADGMHKKMQEIGQRGGRNGRGENYTGGFASMTIGKDGLTGYERAAIAGAKGGRISRRRPKKDDIDRAEEILEQESGRN